MYSRRDFGERSLHVPRNYSGNAFRESAPPAEPPIAVNEELPAIKEESLPPTEVTQASTRSFLGDGGIGSEELLLLGLILLLSQSEKRDDLFLWIALLLFIR